MMVRSCDSWFHRRCFAVPQASSSDDRPWAYTNTESAFESFFLFIYTNVIPSAALSRSCGRWSISRVGVRVTCGGLCDRNERVMTDSAQRGNEVKRTLTARGKFVSRVDDYAGVEGGWDVDLREQTVEVAKTRVRDTLSQATSRIRQCHPISIFSRQITTTTLHCTSRTTLFAWRLLERHLWLSGIVLFIYSLLLIQNTLSQVRRSKI